MNKEHYRLEALKLAVQTEHINQSKTIRELAQIYYDWIIQDAVREEQAKKEEANKPDYKVPPKIIRGKVIKDIE